MVDELTTVGFTKRVDNGKLDTLRHSIYGFDPDDDEPLMHEYIVADVPMDVTESPPPKPEPPT